MNTVPNMVMPSVASTICFVLVIASICVLFIIGFYFGRKIIFKQDSLDAPIAQPQNIGRHWFSFAVLCWLAIGAAVPLSGILESDTLPPPALYFFAVCFGVALVCVCSQAGEALSSLPIAALIGFHAFRLPLEIILHQWYLKGTLPIQMTFRGNNFDIVTGVLAIIIAIIGWRVGRIPVVLVWIFNVVGLALLIAVIGIAITSSPVPFRKFMNDPPVLLVFYFPYCWIVSVAVTGALVGHLIIFRKLLCGQAH